MTRNRIANLRPDYIFLIVRKPRGWTPLHCEDIPPAGEIVSKQFVASYEEAHDDLVRCNELAMHRGLDNWAVVQSAGSDL